MIPSAPAALSCGINSRTMCSSMIVSTATQLGYAEADPTADIEGYDAAQKVAMLVIGAQPQRTERAGRGDDGVVIDAVMGGDFCDFIGHAGTAGDAVDDAFGPLEDAFQNTLGGSHLP